MSKVKTKDPTMVFIPSPQNFRNLHKINVSEETITSAVTRYRSSKETTIFASNGFKASDTVSVYSARPTTTFKSSRQRVFLQYGQALKQKYNPVFEQDHERLLPTNTDDQLRLFAAFVILVEPVGKIPDGETVRLQQLQTLATLAILDFYPDVVFVHGRVILGGHGQLNRLGVCKTQFV